MTHQERYDRNNDNPHCPTHLTTTRQAQTLSTQDNSQSHEPDKLQTVQEPTDQCRPVTQCESSLDHLSHSCSWTVCGAISGWDARSGSEEDDAEDGSLEVQCEQTGSQHSFRELNVSAIRVSSIKVRRRTVSTLVFQAAHSVNCGKYPQALNGSLSCTSVKLLK